MHKPKKQLTAPTPEYLGINPKDESPKWECPVIDIDVNRNWETVEVEKQVKEANAGWPWARVPEKLLTQAPYALNEHNAETGFFRLPQEIQTSPLFNIPRGMEQPILRILFQYHSCASKFAATCQSAFNMVASTIDHWDFSRGGFNGCDENPNDKTDHPASAGKIVVVSQFRVRKFRGENYICDMYGLQNMTHAFVNFVDRFEILHLHRIPLLTTHLLSMVVPLMENLKVLGVYRCELIHLGDALKLLEVIRVDRGTAKKDRVLLDFYPRFHVGPEQIPGEYESTGSYGVTWDNFILDSRLAIWQLLTRILPQAKKQGVDLTGRDSAFKFWLDQSPLWRVDDTIMAIERGDDGMKLAVQVDYPRTRGKTTRFEKPGIWVLEKFECRTCKQRQLGIFFDSEEFKTYKWGGAPYVMLCLGCKLTMHLSFETDHKKTYKHHMVKKWLGDPTVPVKPGQLEWALQGRRKKKGMDAAEWYDNERQKYEATDPGPEKQAPKVKGRRYSPSVYDVEEHGFW